MSVVSAVQLMCLVAFRMCSEKALTMPSPSWWIVYIEGVGAVYECP